ncbi:MULTISPECIES: aspartate/glutamate racemase family protein [unclassified Halanaerobium]|uniref:aspartate/glutamate racemase family protein n=1 Tax=unclassified Halanaerobium TaxID=2641197 RepID=UPI000DF1C121|nr:MULTISPECIES: aspartate/glutamate racemase family protein [unclassified Halanaerobium]RCW44380.1 aspartate/glutamate racemase [Halanaerobium sp. MA284_MarDTE_T2]RCW78652.1 aspartate/glutamate racemase [Halanaerobium sp. DL-01]
MLYKANKNQMNYGEAVGILLLDYAAPFIPGDVGNASTFDYPVRYKLVKGVNFKQLLEKDKSGLEVIIKAAKELERDGVRAITADCGFFALFQKEIAEAVDIPVFLSSLLQIPFISSILDKNSKVGVISAESSKLDDDFLKAVNADPDDIVLKGMEDKESFRKTVIEECGELDSEQMEKEAVEAAEELVRENPEVKAVLLECSMLPPYAKAIQDKVKLPVFDFITMIDYVFSALVKKKYDGFM